MTSLTDRIRTAIRAQNAAAEADRSAGPSLNRTVDRIAEKGAGELRTATEKRKLHRTRTFKSGVVRYNSGLAAMECNIRNLTEKGARLDFANTLGVPSDFVVEISGASKRAAHVVWRSADRIGVEFSS